jgi:hypothetical protein
MRRTSAGMTVGSIRLVALLAAATLSVAVSGASQAEQREARLLKGLLGERPATLVSRNQTQFKTCVDAALRYCEVLNADKGSCWQDRQQQCKAQSGC